MQVRALESQKEIVMHAVPATIHPLTLRPIFGHLIRGRQYAVVRSFRDYDDDTHYVGEVWTFLGSRFLPYEDGLSLFVQCDDGDYQIRLKWGEDEQGEIITNLSAYVLEYGLI